MKDTLWCNTFFSYTIWLPFPLGISFISIFITHQKIQKLKITTDT